MNCILVWIAGNNKGRQSDETNVTAFTLLLKVSFLVWGLYDFLSHSALYVSFYVHVPWMEWGHFNLVPSEKGKSYAVPKMEKVVKIYKNFVGISLEFWRNKKYVWIVSIENFITNRTEMWYPHDHLLTSLSLGGSWSILVSKHSFDFEKLIQDQTKRAKGFFTNM